MVGLHILVWVCNHCICLIYFVLFIIYIVSRGNQLLSEEMRTKHETIRKYYLDITNIGIDSFY